MRITIINRYFWPESVLVNDIARWLTEDGHDVEVLTGQPDYNPEVDFSNHAGNEIWNRVRIRRVVGMKSSGRGMARNLISLWYVLVCASILLFGRRRDCVWLTSIPPVVQPFIIRFVTAVRGTKMIYFPQDIYPEIAVASELMNDSFAAKILQAVDSWVIRKADTVVTISHDMADHLHRRAGLRHKPAVIRSFSPVEEPRPPIDARAPNSPLRFVFAGNIGRFQNLDGLVDAFADIDPNVAILDLLGDGREKARLQAMVSSKGVSNVRFHPFLPVEDAMRFVAQSDVGVVSLRPGIFRYAFPAKTYTYIGAGLPLLTFIEGESELARLVAERGIGLNVAWNEDKHAIKAAIENMAENYALYREKLYANTDDLYLPGLARKSWLEMFRLTHASDGKF